MHHSHEALARPGGIARVGLLVPLRDPEFRKLWVAMCVSLLGDGAFLVAVAWQVYELSDAPTAMSIVGIAMTVPTILFLLVGGVASDRFDRRMLMVAADLLRALAGAVLAGLALGGVLEVWHIAILAALYGTGAAFFAPAFDALVPDIVPVERLAQANALDQLVRPLVLRMAGPALGGILVAAGGTGLVFALDSGSFLFSAAMLVLVRVPAKAAQPRSLSVVRDLAEGWRFVRGRVWLWATFASAAVAYLCFMGPVEVLLPYLVKNELDGSARDLGVVFAAGGLGSVACALAMGQRDIPRRGITFMYVAWTLATLAVAGYGLSSALWQLMLAALAFNALETAGTIVWATMKQRHVPRAMLGRVSSLDWLISIGLLPLSFALTGPVAGAIGTRGTLVAAGVVGAVVTCAAFFVPGMRDIERQAGGSRRPSATSFADVDAPAAASGAQRAA
ncbi:MAG TPA: MFS transporter [Thermoleophilaceae bacterium]|nr:MFS transporter [Thermoleophilaceae bacterium]